MVFLPEKPVFFVKTVGGSLREKRSFKTEDFVAKQKEQSGKRKNKKRRHTEKYEDDER